MRKILLIEDVKTRQDKFMKELSFSLNDYAPILKNTTKSEYETISKHLKDGSFDFSAYSIIFAHKSAFEKESGSVVNKLECYCKERNIPLVLYSGGSLNYYKNIGYEHLELNSKDFYSQNLKIFLESFKRDSENLFMLSYGERWKLNITLNVLEKLNLFLLKNKEDDIEYMSFRNATNIEYLNKLNYDFYEMGIDDGWVFLKEIEKMQESIEKQIQIKTAYM